MVENKLNISDRIQLVLELLILPAVCVCVCVCVLLQNNLSAYSLYTRQDQGLWTCKSNTLRQHVSLLTLKLHFSLIQDVIHYSLSSLYCFKQVKVPFWPKLKKSHTLITGCLILIIFLYIDGKLLLFISHLRQDLYYRLNLQMYY